jgi:DUF4097 and DUF4098 domain-containing protein YvlB
MPCTRHSVALALLLVVVGAAPAAAQRDLDRGDVRSRIDTSFAFSRTGTVDLSLISGEIIVTGSSRDEIKVRAYSERGRLEMDAGSSHFSLEAHSDRGRMGDTKYEVSVPAGVRLLMRTTSGDLQASGVRGPVEGHSTSGDVQISDASGRVILESVSGDVRGHRLSGEVRAQSVSGDVELEDVNGDVRIESTSGEISLTRVTSKDVDATTVSGEVTYQGSIDRGGRYEFHSHSGDIRLEVPSDLSARFAIETFSGSLDSGGFPITLQPGERTGRRPRRFEFTIGGGDAKITAESFSGDIVLSRGSRR